MMKCIKHTTQDSWRLKTAATTTTAPLPPQIDLFDYVFAKVSSLLE